MTAFHLRCVIAVGLMLTSALPAQTQSLETSTRKKVIVISSEEDVEKMTHLVQVSASHFRDLNAEVSLEVVSWTPRDVVAQVETARRLVAARDAFSAIWVEKSSEEIFLFVSDKTSQKVFVQTFEGSGDDWEAESETIAALVRSALTTWLEVIPKSVTDEEETGPSGPEPVSAFTEKKEFSTSSGRTASSSNGNSSKPAKQETNKNPSSKPKELLIGRFDAGFAPRLVHRDEPWTYNGRIGGQFLLFESFTIGFAAQVGSSLPLEIPNDDVRLRHFPLYFELGVWHAFDRVELGASLSAILDIAYLDENGAVNDSLRQQPGMGLLFTAGYRVFPIMSISAFVGADFFFKTARYTLDSEPVLLFGPTQPYIGLGLVFFTKSRKANSK
jgi:hypothetical protein